MNNNWRDKNVVTESRLSKILSKTTGMCTAKSATAVNKSLHTPCSNVSRCMWYKKKWKQGISKLFPRELQYNSIVKYKMYKSTWRGKKNHAIYLVKHFSQLRVVLWLVVNTRHTEGSRNKNHHFELLTSNEMRLQGGEKKKKKRSLVCL